MTSITQQLCHPHLGLLFHVLMSNCKCCKHASYQRYITCTMTCLSLMLLYGARHALSASLPHLIFVKLEKINHTEGEVCPDAINYVEPIEMVHEEYLEWSKDEQHYIFSSFYIGYILLHIPSGMICDIYGARHFLSVGVLATGFVIAAFPIALTQLPWYYVACLQILLGSLQGICMPAIMSLLQHWIPVGQQTFLTSLGYSGGCLGSMLSSVMTTYFVTRLRWWQFTFYCWSCLIAIWYVFFIIFVYSRPITHPRVSQKERSLLGNQFGTDMPKKIPWKHVMSDSAVWALFAGQLGHNCLIFTVDTYLPEFFTRVIGFDLKSNFYIFCIPYMCQWISTLLSGYLGDYLVSMNYVPVVYMRGIFAGIGNVVSSLFVLLATYMNCNKPLILFCFTAALIAKGCIFASLKSNILDISRHYSGVIQGLHNGLPAFTGIASPQIIGYMCKRHTLAEWRSVFWFAFAICSFTTTFYAIWSRGERANWDVITEENTRRLSEVKH